MGNPGRRHRAGLVPEVRQAFTGLDGPRSSSHLAEGTGPPATDFRRWGGETYRIGVRAFSTLEGYAGRNRETESAFSGLMQENARPPSRFSSEIGTKADAKQQNQGFSVC